MSTWLRWSITCKTLVKYSDYKYCSVNFLFIFELFQMYLFSFAFYMNIYSLQYHGTNVFGPTKLFVGHILFLLKIVNIFVYLWKVKKYWQFNRSIIVLNYIYNYSYLNIKHSFQCGISKDLGWNPPGEANIFMIRYLWAIYDYWS